MQKQQIPLKNSLLLLLAAIIWGIAFVAQSVGMKYVGGFTFNAVRSLIGAVVLIPLLPKHLADLTPQVILYPICRRKKL